MNGYRNAGERRPDFTLAAGWLLIFLGFTLMVRFLDRQPIGPENSVVGFATLNGAMRGVFGGNGVCYLLSKLLGYLALLLAAGQTALAAAQFFRRGGIGGISSDRLAMLFLYALTVLLYLLFNLIVINYRPVLEDGALEASYPSSHSLLAMAVFCTAAVQARMRLKNPDERRLVSVALTVLGVLTILFRFLSGVHWFTDILGGVFLGLCVMNLFRPLVRLFRRQKANRL